MKATRAEDIRCWLREQGMRPSRALGQNFLSDENMAKWIVRFSAVGPGDTVVEVGPGLGALTELIADRGAELYAVEIDARLYRWLVVRMAGRSNVHLLHADAVGLDWGQWVGRSRPWQVVSNLPYAHGTRLLMRWFELEWPPDRILVTVQNDVAERLLAPPGTKSYGLVTVWRQAWYEGRIVREIPRECFYPPPKVRSAVVDLRRLEKPRCRLWAADRLRALVKQAFMHRRKQLRRILLDLPASWGVPRGDIDDWVMQLGLQPTARPETLSLEQWAVLAEHLRDAPSCD